MRSFHTCILFLGRSLREMRMIIDWLFWGTGWFSIFIFRHLASREIRFWFLWDCVRGEHFKFWDHF